MDNDLSNKENTDNVDGSIKMIDTSKEQYCEYLNYDSEVENDDFLKTIKTDECALITSLVSRRVVMPLVKIAKDLDLSANAVTLLGGLSWFISLFTIVASAQLFVDKHHIYSGLLLLFTAILWVWGYLLDVVDGSLARLNKTACRRGFYLDYVFHLIFKPGFVVSIGVALSVLTQSSWWLYFAIFALAANWTSAESTSEHVICEEIGKGRLNPSDLPEETRRRVFLGTTDIKASAENKKTDAKTMCITLGKEILNYYGQPVFFALLAIIDVIILAFCWMFAEGGPFVWKWHFVSYSYLILFCVLLIRLPYRIYREYNRIALLDRDTKQEKKD